MITERDIRQLCQFARTTFKPTLRSHNIGDAYQVWITLSNNLRRSSGTPGVIKDYVNGIVSGYSKLIKRDFCNDEADFNPIDKAVEKMFVRRMDKEKANQ
jgi:hypothetical protein